MAASTTEGFYCSTSGTVFTTKDELNEHYRSDFHRYNLRRKVAGLPPVSLEWFEARKEQLRNSSAAAQKGTRQWVEPLTKKKFASEATYQAFIGSKKYEKLLRDAGLTTPPDPVVVVKRTEPVEQGMFPFLGGVFACKGRIRARGVYLQGVYPAVQYKCCRGRAALYQCNTLY